MSSCLLCLLERSDVNEGGVHPRARAPGPGGGATMGPHSGVCNAAGNACSAAFSGCNAPWLRAGCFSQDPAVRFTSQRMRLGLSGMCFRDVGLNVPEDEVRALRDEL